MGAVIYSRDDYERLIDTSPLFSLDREQQPAAYGRERLRMIEYLYKYKTADRKYDDSEPYDDPEPYGIFITAVYCINKYDPSRGRFLNFFNYVCKLNCKELEIRESEEDRFHGIYFTDDEKRNLRKYKKLVKDMGGNTESPDFYKTVAEAMGKTVSYIKDLEKIDKCKIGSLDYTDENEEGKERSPLEEVDSGEYTDTGLFQNQDAKCFLDAIELVFNQLQERQKPMLAKLITSKFALSVNEDSIIEYFKQKTFFDEGIFEESLQQEKLIPAKDIAKRFGVSEASASRSWNRFVDRLKTNLHHSQQ